MEQKGESVMTGDDQTKAKATPSKRSAAAKNKRGRTADGPTTAQLHEADASDVQASIERAGVRQTKFSDAVASERLADALSKHYCYCPALGWMEWDGKVWSEVTETAVTEVSRRLHKKWYTAALGRAFIEEKSLVTHIRRLLSRQGLSAVVSLSRGLLLVDASQFNQHRDLLNTQSGVVDLRSGKLKKHDPEYFFTKVTSVGFNPKAHHDDWKATLEALRPDARGYMQVRVGQSLTGYLPDDDVICFLRGSGENGKTTFIGGITRAMGSYYRQVSDKVLLADPKSHSTELTDLFGLRLAVIEELPEGNHVNSVLLKKVTSPEITARRMKQDTMTFEASHSFLVTSNYTTHIAETDWGTWRRLKRITFPYTYVKPGQKRRPGQREGDPDLRDRVRNDPAVQEAVLRWLVNGAAQWYANGKKMPPPPSSVVKDTNEWRMKSDLVLGYWSEFLEAADDHYVPSVLLYEHFNTWLKSNRHSMWSYPTFCDRFGSHDMSRGVNGPVQVKASKARRASYPPDPVGGEGEVVKPFRAGKAWTGVRYVVPDE